ncbi:glycosyltransferase [Magnetospirillum moscoviense]|uniref:Glycosyl transferase family 1 n=1 Tax=Magnetospirillum moscoviense TaxID=1437059 RepID=A0A178MRK2_9PROT|nr:glycosyltransferase [Magnetospirillum moscoviense]OAN51563.1 hypothetical protein A6A05_01495 [Magnetospirillum moscoviense]
MSQSSPRTLLHVFPSFAIGGAQMRMVQLANHFGPRYRHLIISMNGNCDALGRLAPDIDARQLEIPVRKSGLWSNLNTFRQVLKDERPDLLVTSNWGTIEWALANIPGLCPHLHMEDGFGPDEVARQLPRRVMTRRLALRRTTVMLPSQTLYSIARNVWHLPKDRLRHIPNGVDCRRFGGQADDGLAARLGLNGPEPVIGTVATLRSEKNLSRLLKAFALVSATRPARLVIIGDGPDMPCLTTLARVLGLTDRVVFTGAMAAPESLLPAFTIFALSSNTEQMPLSVLEAMAAGKPVAATDVGDVRDMVCRENRPFVVAPRTQALAQSIGALLDDPAQAGRIGAANADHARATFDESLMFLAYGALFDGPTPARTRRTLSSQV